MVQCYQVRLGQGWKGHKDEHKSDCTGLLRVLASSVSPDPCLSIPLGLGLPPLTLGQARDGVEHRINTTVAAGLLCMV